MYIKAKTLCRAENVLFEAVKSNWEADLLIKKSSESACFSFEQFLERGHPDVATLEYLVKPYEDMCNSLVQAMKAGNS